MQKKMAQRSLIAISLSQPFKVRLKSSMQHCSLGFVQNEILYRTYTNILYKAKLTQAKETWKDVKYYSFTIKYYVWLNI